MIVDGKEDIILNQFTLNLFSFFKQAKSKLQNSFISDEKYE